MKILIFFYFYIFAECDKLVWDGNKFNFHNIRRQVKLLHDGSHPGARGSIVGSRHMKYTKPIDVIKDVTFINTNILNIDISKVPPKLTGFHFEQYDGDATANHQYLAQNHNNHQYMIRYHHTTCQLVRCEVGLYMLHGSAQESTFLTEGIKSIYFAYYLVLTTPDMNFKFHKFTINGNKYPLVTCPYKRWIVQHSGAYFEPYDHSGIHYIELKETHIILPAYSRSPHSVLFLCGDIVYVDNLRLKIFYEFVKTKENNMEIKTIQVLLHKLICYPNEKPDLYHHFAYDEYSLNMTYIDTDILHNQYLYYMDIVYFYKKNNHVLTGIKQGNEIDHRKVPKEIEPTCAKRLGVLPAAINFYVNDKLEDFSGPKKNFTMAIKIMYITKNMFNKVYKLNCKIDLDDAKNNPSISKYYDKIVKTSLVKYDEDLNIKLIEKVTFKENDFSNYGKYECLLEKIRNQETKDMMNNIRRMTVMIIPDLNNIKEEWQNQFTISIFCPKKLSNFATLENFITISNKNELCNLKKNLTVFETNGGNILFRHDKYLEKNVKIKNVTTTCLYKTADGIEFKIVKDGFVLKEINIKENTQHKNESNVKIILLCCGIIAFGFLFLLVTIVILRSHRRRRKARGKMDGSISSSMNSSMDSSNSSSMSSSMSSSNSLSVYKPSKIAQSEKTKTKTSISRSFMKNKNPKKQTGKTILSTSAQQNDSKVSARKSKATKIK
uniref:EGF-like domain-containing protein n=1 Tax=Parastrongyloides trichosuri TaxID=131310 RepID=A0A0N4Z8V1_PARTI